MDSIYEYNDNNLQYEISKDIELIISVFYIGCLFTTFFTIFDKNRILYIKRSIFSFFIILNNNINNLFGSNLDNENSENEKIENEKKSEIKYEDKYKDRFELLENIELTKEKLDGLKNAIVMETTPLGNVIMFYDNSREGFTYYTDNTLPYRFLETVARKYAVLHNCRCIFIDMDEQIKNAKDKLEEKKKKLIEEEEESKRLKELKQPIPIKRDVFAKLKSYNKDSGLKVAGISGEAKHSTSKKPTEKEEENMILKEKANRYSCEGKIVNFSFLKKIDRKAVDKRYATSFAEFKKMQTGF
jgi:hypothetical protein